MKRRSDAKAAFDVRYSKARAVYLARNRTCKIRWDDDCTRLATDIDHKVRRNHLTLEQQLDESLWQPTCRHCHQRKELNLAEAHERGLALHNWEIP